MEQSRRDFITRALYGLLALLGLGGAFAGLKVLTPTGRREREIAWCA